METCAAVAAAGSEAGGHRGTWYDSGDFRDSMIGTMALVPQVVAVAEGIPVIAAGVLRGLGGGGAVAKGVPVIEQRVC